MLPDAECCCYPTEGKVVHFAHRASDYDVNTALPAEHATASFHFPTFSPASLSASTQNAVPALAM